MKRIALLLALSGAWIVPAFAQTSDVPNVLADNENGRFSMSPVDDGVMRLDSRTGKVSLCRKRTNNWACEVLADERAAYEKEIGRLQDKVTKLETELGRGPGAKEDLKLPNDADVDRVMKFFENILRRFKSMIDNLQREDAPGRL